jgi:hypothetical protein
MLRLAILSLEWSGGSTLGPASKSGICRCSLNASVVRGGLGVVFCCWNRREVAQRSSRLWCWCWSCRRSRLLCILCERGKNGLEIRLLGHDGIEMRSEIYAVLRMCDSSVANSHFFSCVVY